MALWMRGTLLPLQLAMDASVILFAAGVYRAVSSYLKCLNDRNRAYRGLSRTLWSVSRVGRHGVSAVSAILKACKEKAQLSGHTQKGHSKATRGRTATTGTRPQYIESETRK